MKRKPLPNRRLKSPAPLAETVTLSGDDYRRMRAMAVAARRAFEALNAEDLSSDEIAGVTWDLWRAQEGVIPSALQ